MGLCGHLALSCLGLAVLDGPVLGLAAPRVAPRVAILHTSTDRPQFLVLLLKMFGAWSITAVRATGVGSPQSVAVKHTVDLVSLVAAPK